MFVSGLWCDAMADELIDFLPPSGWGDLVRKSDLEATERRLDSDIDALGARLDAKIDVLGARLDAKIDALGARLDARIDALSQRVESLQEEVRRLGNLRSTIIITGLSLFVGLGSLMVAMFQVTGR
jgi:outer membrane murein-binding lipoprotein Lpp